MGWICCCTPCAVRPHYAIDAAPALFLPCNQIVSSPSGMPFGADIPGWMPTHPSESCLQSHIFSPHAARKRAAAGAVFTPFRHGYEKSQGQRYPDTLMLRSSPFGQTDCIAPAVRAVIFPIAHDVLRDKVPHKQRRIQIMFRPHPSNPSRTSNSVTIATSGRTGIINADTTLAAHPQYGR